MPKFSSLLNGATNSMHFAGLLEAGNELFYVNHLEECLAHGKSHISVSYKNNNYYFSVCCLQDSNPASLPALTPTPPYIHFSLLGPWPPSLPLLGQSHLSPGLPWHGQPEHWSGLTHCGLLARGTCRLAS